MSQFNPAQQKQTECLISLTRLFYKTQCGGGGGLTQDEVATVVHPALSKSG